MKKVKRIFSITLACIMATTVVASAAYAAEEDLFNPRVATGTFSITLPKQGGGPNVGTPIMKELDIGYAVFGIQTLSNSSGLPCYLSMYSSDGRYPAGEEESVAGTGSLSVNYLYGYGSVGSAYCPSGRTDTDSLLSATISGVWRP